MLETEVAHAWPVVEDPRRVDLQRVRNAHSRRHAIVELRPAIHVRRNVDVRQINSRVPESRIVRGI